MRTVKTVSAGLDLIAERRKNDTDLDRFLKMLDEVAPDDDDGVQAQPIRRPYSGRELQTTDRWK